MRSVTLIAPAKINLYLEIIGSRPDGFHELAMVLQSISLSDRITINPISIDAIAISCNDPSIPTDQSNLAHRAASLMVKQFPDMMARYGGIEIDIHKQIPAAAGLAGGSSDAAAVLVGLDLIWDLGLTQGELQTLGAEIGSDVPFCITGGTALATGRGEVLSPLANLENLYVVLAKFRNIAISTPWAYQTYRQQFSSSYSQPHDLKSRQNRVHSGPMVAAIMERQGTKIGKLLHNDLEKVALPEYPQVAAVRDAFTVQEGVLGAMMSGSGPTVFALVESQAQADRVLDVVQNQIANQDLCFWTAKFISTGIRFA